MVIKDSLQLIAVRRWEIQHWGQHAQQICMDRWRIDQHKADQQLFWTCLDCWINKTLEDITITETNRYFSVSSDILSAIFDIVNLQVCALLQKANKKISDLKEDIMQFSDELKRNSPMNVVVVLLLTNSSPGLRLWSADTRGMWMLLLHHLS